MNEANSLDHHHILKVGMFCDIDLGIMADYAFSFLFDSMQMTFWLIGGELQLREVFCEIVEEDLSFGVCQHEYVGGDGCLIDFGQVVSFDGFIRILKFTFSFKSGFECFLS